MQKAEEAIITRMETIRAQSKDELYRRLFETCGTQQYHIVDEKTKREFPFFWKKEHELKIMIVEQQEVPKEEQEEAPSSSFQASLSEELEKEEKKETDDKMKRMIKRLETDISEAPPAPAYESTPETAAEKAELLKKLREGFSLYPAEQETNLREAIARIHEKLHTEPASDSPVIAQFADVLREHDVDEAVVETYMNKLKEKFQSGQQVSEQEVRDYLLTEIAHEFKTAPPLNPEDSKIIALFGPTGVGKTTTIAKLGWQLHAKNKKVGFITTDVFRSGAVEQLQAYADRMRCELRVASQPEELREAVRYFLNIEPVDHILIDTAGRNYVGTGYINEVQEYFRIVKPDVTCLTLSASMRKKDVLAILAKTKDIKVNYLILTKLDETSALGEWLTLASAAQVPLLFVTTGQDITKHIQVPTGEWLAERILVNETKPEGDIFSIRDY